LLRDHLTAQGRVCQLLSFPDYATPIGGEISKALHGERDYPPDVLQLLYVANRGEKRAQIEAWIADGVVVICDRYVASSIAYGEAHGLDAPWLAEIQRFLPAPHLTILLDIAPETAAGRKATARDRFERDLDLLARVRASYRRQAGADGWVRLEGQRAKAEVAADVIRSVETRLGLPSPR
jgi:dTMP kinase